MSKKLIERLYALSDGAADTVKSLVIERDAALARAERAEAILEEVKAELLDSLKAAEAILALEGSYSARAMMQVRINHIRAFLAKLETKP